MRVEPRIETFQCAGCRAVFDEEEDVCTIPHVIGTQNVGALCARCHVTALGEKPPHSFRDKQLL